MEVQVGGLLFVSNFDSGNLGRVEKVTKVDNNDIPIVSNIQPIKSTDFQTDNEFNIWTKPDCANTIYENSNRSWFHFGVRGALPGKLIKINIMNMNKQGRLYSQGYCPIVRTLPGKPKWERIRDKPSFETIEGQFILSFIYRFTEPKGSTTYFAFAYPHSYLECQNQVSEIERRFEYCKNISSTSSYPKDTIYFYRELLCHSLENLRIDLITISSFDGITDQEEPRFDAKLFPDKEVPRCQEFKDKRVFVLTSRVHPGETPASFVFSGFLNFILRNEDPRAIQLRKQFVFKLIPILNPDGVYNGHYRTDTRGVNLNRVYSDPSFELNPSIYAAKSMIIYYHVNYRLNKSLYSNIDFPPAEISTEAQKSQSKDKPKVSSSNTCSKKLPASSVLQHSPRSESPGSKYKSRIYDQYNPSKYCDNPTIQRQHSLDSFDTNFKKKSGNVSFHRSQQTVNSLSFPHAMSENSSDSEDSIEKNSIQNNMSQSGDHTTSEALLEKVNGDLLSHLSTLSVSDHGNNTMTGPEESPANFHPHSPDSESEDDVARLGNEGSDEDQDIEPALKTNITFSPHLNNSAFKQILPQHSGVAFYVDLHSHASRKGCFIYGNFLEDDELQIQNMLYPKLVSLNTAHFEFSACNFTQRNMYLRDKRDGLSKEGSGRVAVYKSTGIIHSYTLECNYNTGKIMNCIAPAYGDNGRASPPTVVGIPPKYTPSIFEDVGRAVAIAALDMNDTNPWSRVTLSEYKHLLGAKEWLKKYCLIPKGFIRSKNPKPPLRTLSFSHMSSTTQGRYVRPSDSFSSTSSGPPSMTISSHLSSQMATKKELRPVREASRRFSSCPRKLNLLVSDKGSMSHSTNRPPHGSYPALSGNTSQSFPSTRSKSLPVSKLSASNLSPCKLNQSSLSRGPSFDSCIPKSGKIGQLKSAPSSSVRSKTSTNSSSSIHKKSLNRPNLVRSMSGASDSHCLNARCYHSHSDDCPKFTSSGSSSHGRSHSFKQRSIHSASDNSLMTNKKKLSSNLTKLDNTGVTHSSSEIKKMTAESTTNEIPRNIPPKKKRRFSLIKKKQAAVNFLKGNIGKNVLKDEHCHNVELEKLPRKRKKSSRHSLPSLAPLQVADSGSDMKLREEGYTAADSHSLKISSKHTKQLGQEMGVQDYNISLSQDSNKMSEEQIWPPTNNVFHETDRLPLQSNAQ